MLRARDCAILGFGLMLAATSTEARELGVSVENRIGWDTNVFRTSDDEVRDGFYELAPRFALRERQSKLNYDFSYSPTYDAYFDTSGINGFDHAATGNLVWKPTPIDSFNFITNYGNYRRVVLDATSNVLDPTAAVEASDRERTQRADATLSYRHYLTEVTSVSASTSFEDIDYSEASGIVDSRAYSGQLGVHHVYDEKTSLGLIGTARLRQNRGVEDLSLAPPSRQPTVDTDIFGFAVSIERRLTPTISLSVQVGPSYISSKRREPTQSPPVRVDYSQSTSLFADVQLKKTWQHSTLTADYTRSESGNGGTTSSSISDVARLDFVHEFDRRWNFYTSASWNRLEEIGPTSAGDDGLSTNYQFLVSLERIINRQVSVLVHYSFRTLNESGSTVSSSIGDIHSGFISVRYTFDPVVF